MHILGHEIDIDLLFFELPTDAQKLRRVPSKPADGLGYDAVNISCIAICKQALELLPGICTSSGADIRIDTDQLHIVLPGHIRDESGDLILKAGGLPGPGSADPAIDCRLLDWLKGAHCIHFHYP